MPVSTPVPADSSADLKKPLLAHGKLTSDPDPQKAMMTQDEFEHFYKTEGKKYMWDNNFSDVSEAGQDLKKQYRGQR